MKITPVAKPKGVRDWIAYKLVALAMWIKPESEATKAFFMQEIMDDMIYGQFITRIGPETIYSKKKHK